MELFSRRRWTLYRLKWLAVVFVTQKIWGRCTATFHTRLTVGPIRSFISFYLRDPCQHQKWPNRSIAFAYKKAQNSSLNFVLILGVAKCWPRSSQQVKLSRRKSDPSNQCDQIGKFLKVFFNNFSYKTSPNIRQLFGLFWCMSLFKKKN